MTLKQYISEFEQLLSKTNWSRSEIIVYKLFQSVIFSVIDKQMFKPTITEISYISLKAYLLNISGKKSIISYVAKKLDV